MESDSGLNTSDYLLITAFAVLGFVIILVILRYCSTKCSRLWFASVYKYVVTPLLKKGSDHIREKMLADIKRLQSLNPSKPLRILEVGAALGLNFQYYPPNCRVTALEINNFFEKYFNENKSKFSHICCDGFIVGNAEDMKEIADNSFDVVVATYLLCTVKNPDKAVNEIKRVLIGGGTYYYLEHIGFPGNSVSHRLLYAIQLIVSPFWYTLFEGCHLCRQQHKIIDRTGFKASEFNIEYPAPMFILTRAQMWGKAVKHI